MAIPTRTKYYRHTIKLGIETLEWRLCAAVQIVQAPANYEFADMGYDSASQAPVIVGYEQNGPNKTAKIFELNGNQTGFVGTTLPGLAQSTYPTAPVYVYGISANGQRIAGLSKSVGSINAGEGTTWLKNDPLSPVGIGWLSGLCANTSAAIGAWQDGVVGDCGGGARAVKWTQATGITDLGGYTHSAGQVHSANDVSSDGSVSVGFSTHEVFDGAAYYWDSAGIHRLPDAIPGSTIYQSIAYSISPNGDYIGGYIAEDTGPVVYSNAALWKRNSSSNLYDLNLLKDSRGNRIEGGVFGITDSGYVVGTASFGSETKGFIWHQSFDGVQTPFNGAQIFDHWLANIPNGAVLPFQSKGIEAISEDTPNNRLLFALSDHEAPGASAFVSVTGIQGLNKTGIVNRQVFYNNSTSSVFGSGAGNPITAIDASKVPLFPGETANFSNYTNYSRGLNGIVVDFADSRPLGVSDFAFATWDGRSAAGFVGVPNPPVVTHWAGGGLGGGSRIKIEFPDGAIRNTWLRITVLSNGNTGLPSNEVFYFGNSVGDMNIGNTGSPVDVRVNAIDTSAIRQNQSTSANSVNVRNIYDVNKDGRVDATDTSIVRQNQQPIFSIRLFTAPVNSFIASSYVDLSFQTGFGVMDHISDWSFNPIEIKKRRLGDQAKSVK